MIIQKNELAGYLDIPADEMSDTRFEALEREVRAMIGAHCPSLDLGAEVPESVRVVALRVVARAWDSAGDGGLGATATQVSSGPFSMSHTFNADGGRGGLYFSRADRSLLRAVCGGNGGAFSVDQIPAYADGRGVRADYYDGWFWR